MSEIKEIQIEEIYSSADKENNLQVYLFNVGQGDHIMLKFPNNEYGIIDFFYDASQNIIEPPALSYFKALEGVLKKGVLKERLKRTPTKEELEKPLERELQKKLDKELKEKVTISFFCISHTDKDHTKGIGTTIEWFYSKGILIKEFWFPAAHDETQIRDFVTKKIPGYVRSKSNELKAKNRIFEKELDKFYHFYDELKKEHQKKNPGVRFGDYLVDLKFLREPCSLQNCRAINLGPLYDDAMKRYAMPLTADITRRMLAPDSEPIQELDKNEISHILLIRYGCSNLLFGGDTHRETWEKCLQNYSSYLDIYKEIDCHFIKVSHHGSEYSSSPQMWNRLLNDERETYFGILAGNNRYRHPHDVTINQIKGAKKKPIILSTNICCSLIDDNIFEKEHHIWYDNYINECEECPSLDAISETEISTNEISENWGLFAYIFEIPYAEGEEKKIKVRKALSKTNRDTGCFNYDDCEHKLASCKKSYIPK